MFPILTLTGPPDERGRHYGTHAAAQIRHSIASYARLFAYRRGVDWATIQAEAQTYVPVLEDAAPDLFAEMCGIAEGAGRALSEIVALNARTELLAGATRAGAHPDYARATAQNRARGVPDHSECTTVAALPQATARGDTLLAQTWDWNGDQRDACVVLRIQAAGHSDILTLTEAGMLAKIGLNSAGLGVCLNILRSQADGQSPGMPVHVLLRRILQMPGVAEALAEAHRVPAAASSCITVGDSTGQALSLEITPGGIGQIEPQDGVLVHTNHCVAAETRAGECAIDPASSTIPRYNRATELLIPRRGRIDTATLMDVLRDRHGAPNCICRRPDARLHPAERAESVAGIVLDLPARVMHIAPGVPCDVDFTPVGLVG